MEDISPREILSKHGKWIGATEFAKLVAEKRSITERQAKNLMSEAYHAKEIKKHVFSDRTVIYGLTEFGPPVSSVSSDNGSIASKSETGTFPTKGIWNPAPRVVFF